MAKTTLETAIEKAAGDFALVIIDAIKSATLQELMELQQSTGLPASPPRPPVARKAPAPAAAAAPAAPRKKRVVKNYPKCAYPGCNKNRFPRGKGFCGEHWREFKEGKIKDAAFYRKDGDEEETSSKPVVRRRSKKAAK